MKKKDKRPYTPRPKGAAKVAATERKIEAAKQRIETAFDALPPYDDDAWPRTDPILILDSRTKKWERWKEIEPADRTPKPLIPAITALVHALNTDVNGKRREAGKAPKKAARQSGMVVALKKLGQTHLVEGLEGPIRKRTAKAILRALEAAGQKVKLKPESLARRLRRSKGRP